MSEPNSYNFNDKRKEYSFLYIGTGVLHFLYAILFSYSHTTALLIYNIVAVVFYIVLSRWILVAKQVRVVFLTCFAEIILFSVTGTIFVGYESGFYLYLLSIIPLLFYLFYKLKADKLKEAVRYIYIIFLLIIGSVSLNLFGVVKDLGLAENYIGHFFLLNVSVALLLSYTFCNVMLKSVNDKENVLIHSNEQLSQEANFDKLTGLLNRRTIDYYYDLKMTDLKYKGDSFVVIMADIDSFKKVNDKYGHEIGDVVLKKVSSTLQRSTRNNDKLFRWGGEELVSIVTASEEESLIVGERYRSNIEKIVFDEVEDLKVTITVGIYLCQVGDKLEDAVNRADKALYEGKQTGKNKVVVAR